jgi:Family of unknown function (DUF6600)
MKYVIKLARRRVWTLLSLIMPFLASLNCISTMTGTSQNNDDIEFNVADLNDNGDWIYMERFGRVWRPWVAEDWRPFSYGNWVYDGNDWIWDSYEPYGWAVYHYGNWYYDSSYGWIWIPGNVWSRACVVWMNYDDYIAWAPIPPVGITWADPWETPGFTEWNVVMCQDFDRDNIGYYRVAKPPRYLGSKRVTIINDAPKIEVVQRYTQRSVRRVNIRSDEIIAGHYKYRRIRMPADELNRNEVYRQEVREKVLRPKRIDTLPAEETRPYQEQTEKRKDIEHKEIEPPQPQQRDETRPYQEQTEKRKDAEQKEIEQPQQSKEIKPDQEKTEKRKESEQKEIEQTKPNKTEDKEKPVQQQREVKQEPVKKEKPLNPKNST